MVVVVVVVVSNRKVKTSLDLNDARDDGVLERKWHQLDHMQTIWHQTDNHTSTSSLNFYKPDALPDAQPTVSKRGMEVVNLLHLCVILYSIFRCSLRSLFFCCLFYSVGFSFIQYRAKRLAGKIIAKMTCFMSSGA